MKKEMKEQTTIIKALDFETLVELADMFEDYENEHKLSEELKAFDLCLHTALRDRCLELIEEEKKLKAIIEAREEIAEEDREYTKDSNNKFKEKYGFSSIETEPASASDYMGSKTFYITFEKNNKIECIEAETATLNAKTF